MNLPLGPVMLDVEGTLLTPQDRVRLQHPQCGGVILFARNYQNPEQLGALCDEIHELRSPSLLIAADHEGGRVQRFRDGFVRLPAMAALGSLWNADHASAAAAAREMGFLIAIELGACGIDFSFTPVLDLDHGLSAVIGDRALHSDPEAVCGLAEALIAGLHEGGMAAIGKHFPGHGHVAEDSHVDVPVDVRELVQIEATDLIPFARLASHLQGIMPAHVIYPAVDARPAGFSKFWLQDVLRRKLRFEGVIFSDDLTMEGASVEGGIESRARSALAAGCDMVLVCNDPDAADRVLNALSGEAAVRTNPKLAQLTGRPLIQGLAHVRNNPRYRTAVAATAAIERPAPAQRA
ncbi:MAG: beta-N-acetylhexosaminidase [Burkholderiales bacterium]